jgi:hypothetical protein
MFATTAAALIFLCSCGSGGPASSGGGPGPVQERTVTGIQVVTYISETGKTDVPDDLSKTTIAAYVPDGSGGYNMLPGSGSADGHYSIPNVPAGGYLLQIGSSYFWTSATNIDTGSQVQGRPNPTPSPTGLEKIDFDVALTVPTQSPDSEFVDKFELVDPNIATGEFEYAPNASSSDSFDQVWFWVDALIDASLGDKTYLSHLITSGQRDSTTQIVYGTLVQEEITPALSIQMVPGVTTNLSSSMVQGPAATFRANFKLSSFGALSPQMVAQSLQTGDLFAGVAAAAPLNTAGGFPGSFNSTAPYPVSTLAAFQLSPPAPAADFDLGDMSYRSGFPANYTTLVFADWVTSAFFSLSGASTTSLNADIKMNTLTAPTATKPLTPLIGPVTALSLDGTDAFNKQSSDVSLTPTIAWNVPLLGTPSFYQVDVIQLTVVPCQIRFFNACTVSTNVATFQTQQTSLTLPPGLLTPGSTYVLAVTAKNAVAANLDSSPLRITYPFAYADAISQMFTTAGVQSAAVAHTQGSYGPLIRSRKDLSARRH